MPEQLPARGCPGVPWLWPHPRPLPPWSSSHRPRHVQAGNVSERPPSPLPSFTRTPDVGRRAILIQDVTSSQDPRLQPFFQRGSNHRARGLIFWGRDSNLCTSEPHRSWECGWGAPRLTHGDTPSSAEPEPPCTRFLSGDPPCGLQPGPGFGPAGAPTLSQRARCGRHSLGPPSTGFPVHLWLLSSPFLLPHAHCLLPEALWAVLPHLPSLPSGPSA